MAIPTSPSLARGARATSTYTELAAVVRESGLLRRRYGYYWTRIAATVLAFAALWAAVVLLGNSWWQLVLAGILGLLLTQCGFLGHDAAHRQIFASAAWNDWTARVLSGAFAGLSLTWWRSKHNRHHAAPNQEGRDPDIAPGLLALTNEIAGARTRGMKGWFTRRQGWFFFPLLALEGLNLHVSGIRTLLARGASPHRRAELLIVVARLSGYVAVLLVLLRGRQGGGVHRGAAGRVRRVPGQRVRAQSHRDAGRGEERPYRLPPAAGVDVAQRAGRGPAEPRDGPT